MVRVGYYYEIIIFLYIFDEFKIYFCLFRDIFESMCQRLFIVNVYNNLKGFIFNFEKEFLMFLWYIGNFESF